MRGSRLRGAFSAQMKNLLSSVFLLIHQVLFVTSDTGSSSSWTMLFVQAPLARILLLVLYFGHVFLLLGVHLCEARAQRGPLVQCRVLGSIKIEPASQHILVLSAPELDILFHC